LLLPLPASKGAKTLSGPARQATKQSVSRKDGVIRPFLGDHSGASALEFALLVAPLLVLLLGVLEVGIVFFANFTLENAVSQGARLIRTGQAQAGSFDATAFRTEVCKHLSAPITCANLKLDVRHFTNFSGISLTNPLDANGNLKTSFTYDPGVGGDVVVVRAFYEWNITAKFPQAITFIDTRINMGLGNMGNGDRLLSATAAFRNEPFQPN
jgi:Flp pilus assembly protein TadG